MTKCVGQGYDKAASMSSLVNGAAGKIKGIHGKFSIVASYTPTKEVDEIEKDYFYETLQSVVAEIPRHDITCVVGDLNVKVESCHTYCPEVMGQHGIGDMNKNGALLVNYALNNNLVIG
ncbi:hypothetical protein QYM36_005426, partial [Artemia franciscana]